MLLSASAEDPISSLLVWGRHIASRIVARHSYTRYGGRVPCHRRIGRCYRSGRGNCRRFDRYRWCHHRVVLFVDVAGVIVVVAIACHRRGHHHPRQHRPFLFLLLLFCLLAWSFVIMLACLLACFVLSAFFFHPDVLVRGQSFVPGGGEADRQGCEAEAGQDHRRPQG